MKTAAGNDYPTTARFAHGQHIVVPFEGQPAVRAEIADFSDQSGEGQYLVKVVDAESAGPFWVLESECRAVNAAV